MTESPDVKAVRDAAFEAGSDAGRAEVAEIVRMCAAAGVSHFPFLERRMTATQVKEHLVRQSWRKVIGGLEQKSA